MGTRVTFITRALARGYGAAVAKAVGTAAGSGSAGNASPRVQQAQCSPAFSAVMARAAGTLTCSCHSIKSR